MSRVIWLIRELGAWYFSLRPCRLRRQIQEEDKISLRRTEEGKEEALRD